MTTDDGGPSTKHGPGDTPPAGQRSDSPTPRAIGRVLPDVVRQNLTAKLLLLLLVGTSISGAVVAVSYTTINDEITDQVRAQMESDTTLQATVYENWLTERWTTLNSMAESAEMHHDSTTVVHQWLVAEQTGVSDDVHSLYVADTDTGTVLGSTDTAFHGTNLYAAGLNETAAGDLLFISRKPIELDADLPPMTLIGTHAGDRLLVAAVPANTTLVRSQSFEGATTSLRSLDGHRLLGATATETVLLPAESGGETVVVDRGDSVLGVQVIAHDVLDGRAVESYDEATTVGTVVVTRAPKTAAFAIRDRVSETVAIAFSLTLVLLIGTAAVSMRSVTAAVNRLSKKTRRISDGSLDVDVTTARLDEIGALYESVGAMRDSLRERIDQAKRRERQMDEAREEAEQARTELRQIIDLVPDPISAKNRDGEYILANQTIAEYYGYEQSADIEGKSSVEVVPDEAQARKFNADDREVLATGEPKRIAEDTLVTAAGEERTLQTTKIPFETVRTGEAAVLGYDRDVTELKARERELQEREEKYRSLFEDTHDALMLFDRDGYFDCNESALELFGVESVEAFLEYAPWELAPPEQPDGRDSKAVALEHIETAFREGEESFEFTHQRVDGTAFPSAVKLSRFDNEGQPALHGLVRDITERKEYQRRLERQRDNLEILNQMVRHDIRNDLQVILGYADVLETAVDDGNEEYVRQLLTSASHAVDITATAREVSEVMLQSRAELAAVRFRHVLEDEIDDIQSSRDHAVVTTDGPLPDVTVQADELLGSVFRNLLTNAIDHNDTAIPKVTVSATDQGDYVRLRVADNGPGVADERKEAIFEEGEQGIDSDGSGLGLYLVRTLVEQYGGEVWVEDRATDGTDGAVFVVDLPTGRE